MGHGLGPSAQLVPPRTLKQQVEIQRSRECQESILRASGGKEYPVPRESSVSGVQGTSNNHTGCGVQADGSKY